jgi:hypothetical protein
MSETPAHLKEFIVIRRSVEDQKIYVMAVDRRHAMKLARAGISAVKDFRGDPITEGMFDTNDPYHLSVTYRHHTDTNTGAKG